LPLTADVTITGHPIVRLWLSTEAPDLDVFVYLEELDRSGKSNYVTEGNLRASNRRVSAAPFKHDLGLPYHSHARRDATPLAKGEPVELILDLQPISHRFRAGNNIRVTVAFADADNFDTPVINPPPRVRLLRNRDCASSIDLPADYSQTSAS